MDGRSILLVFFTSLLISACNTNPATVTPNNFALTKLQCSGTAIPNRFIVKWTNGNVTTVSSPDRDTFIREFMLPNGDAIEVAEHDQVVTFTQPLEVVQATSTPIPDDWGQQITQAPAVWQKGIEGQGILVAVVDAGVDLTHPQLKNQIYVNPGEIPNNKIDDDKNGFIDDVSGWDFANQSANVLPMTDHGTHVSGIILAEHSSGPVFGMAQKAKLLPLNFMSSDGSGTMGDAISAINYAALMGAKVINASWGGSGCSTVLESKIADLDGKGILFVTAAGNDSQDIGSFPSYPASYNLPSQITVGASSSHDYMAGFSNFSTTLVHLVAPGMNILSSVPNYTATDGTNQKNTAYMSGTSMATPFVTGAVALAWSYRPQATAAQIKAAILNGVDAGPFSVSTAGRLNISRTINQL